MKLCVRCLMVLLGCCLFLTSNQMVTYAQTASPRIVFCVNPRAGGGDPYIIEFWDSIVFGILIPENARVSVFSNTFYSSALYTVNTNAKSGGYLAMEHLATVNTVTEVANGNPCWNEDTRELFAQLPYKTLPLPISINHAIVVQEGNSDELANPFQRVVSFTFGIGGEEGSTTRNLQIIQNSESDPFLNFRYLDLEPNTPFIVVANKDFAIGQSLPDTDPPEFSRERPSDIRSFVKSDLEDLYGLNIFEVAKQSNARIYISSGLLDTYRGTYIRVSLAPDTVERIPALLSGVLVRALPDATATFVSLEQIGNNLLQLDLPYETNPFGIILGDSVYRIIEVNDRTGQLVLDFDGNPVIVEGWLVEAVTDE
jgi:hypothetical protein